MRDEFLKNLFAFLREEDKRRAPSWHSVLGDSEEAQQAQPGQAAKGKASKNLAKDLDFEER